MTRPSGKRRPLLRRLGAVLLSSLLGLAALEAALRTLPLKRASALANEVYTAYGSFPGGIYFTEPETRINFMVPNLETVNFWNGYSWRHRADGLGFRNPPGLKDRSLLLLGDSLIYGHGVEEEQTVAHILRTRDGRPAYNMARQGDCLYQQYVLLRLYRDELAPRTVVLFVFFNDFSDLLFYRTREEIERMPELGLDDRALRRRVADLGRNPRYPPRRQLYRLRSLRLLRGVAKSFSGDWMARAEAAPAGEDDLAAAVLRPEPFALASRYYRRVLGECQRLAAGKGAVLQVVLLDAGAGPGSDGQRAYERLRLFLEKTSGEAGFSFTTTAGVFAGCGDCFLPHDGHFSPQGHARLARFLDARLQASSPEVRTR
ncbi:MAG TPA: hypothetical protein VHC97_04865 [Thermoanaerobaculia bacterium]|jgi:hypothetical protein|nr:hypothetical protein [Thermoanaerobaculia bacterium]